MTDDRSTQDEKPSTGSGEDASMSKEEWLRQNPGPAFDPAGEQIEEGMTKEEYLRKVQDGGDQSGSK
jgi:hypothetical protein